MGTKRYELTEREWNRIKDMLPPEHFLPSFTLVLSLFCRNNTIFFLFQIIPNVTVNFPEWTHPEVGNDSVVMNVTDASNFTIGGKLNWLYHLEMFT